MSESLVILDQLGECLGISSHFLELGLFSGNQLLQVLKLAETWSWDRSDDLWWGLDGTLEDLVLVVNNSSWGGWFDVLNGLDDSLCSDQLSVDLSDQSGGVSDLSGQLSDNLVDLDDLLLGDLLDVLQVSQFSLDNDGSLWLGWLDKDVLWSSLDNSDLSDDLLDNLSDVNNGLLDDSDLLSQDGDLLSEDWSLWSWGSLDLLNQFDDLSSDNSDLLGQFGDLDDVNSDDLVEFLDNNNILVRMETSQRWSGELGDS